MRESVYQGRTITRSESGRSETCVKEGELSELVEYLESLEIGGSGMRIVSARLSQHAGKTWRCEIEKSDAHDTGGGGGDAPSDEYGKKSATLTCGIMSMPLETHKKYLANWNYFLASADKVKKKSNGEYDTVETKTVPGWWDSAKDTILSATQALDYRWIKAPSELPGGIGKDSRVWHILKEPTKPGLESYDLATYQVQESVHYKTAKQCGSYVAGRMNKIATPGETFGITGGNWKVDGATIAWDGTKWKATLTYTMSGNDRGWDRDFYA